MGRYLEIALALPMPESGSEENGEKVREKREKGLAQDLNVGKPAAVREQKGALPDLRAGFTILCAEAIKLRCRETGGRRRLHGNRTQALAWLTEQIDALADACDLLSDAGQAIGFTDPGDPFGGEQVRFLRSELADLTRPDAPYPLGPLSDDPFGMTPPRLYNGKLAG